MSYTKHDVRTTINKFIDFKKCQIDDCEELNYIVMKLCISYIKHNGLNYQTFNDIVGVLDNAKTEFRQQALPNINFQHEDLKIV